MQYGIALLALTMFLANVGSGNAACQAAEVMGSCESASVIRCGTNRGKTKFSECEKRKPEGGKTNRKDDSVPRSAGVVMPFERRGSKCPAVETGAIEAQDDKVTR